MNEFPEVFKTGIKRSRLIGLVLMVVLLLAAASFVFAAMSAQNKLKAGPMHLNDFLLSENQKEMTYVYVDIVEDPWEVAQRTEDKRVTARYYLLWDGDFLYLAKLTGGEELALIGDLGAGRTARVEGMTRPIPTELKKICIEVFADEFGIVLNDDNFADYLGLYLVDPSAKESEPRALYISAASMGFLALIAVAFIISRSRQQKKAVDKYSFDEWQYIAHEYNSGNYYASLNKNRLVLTENFIINNFTVPDVMRYSDVVWVFGSVVRNTGVPIATGISVYTSDAKEHLLATATAATKGQTNLRDDFMIKILERCPNALVGYTGEARTAARERFGINR